MEDKEFQDRLQDQRYIPNKLTSPTVFIKKRLPGIGTVDTPDAIVLIGPMIITFLIGTNYVSTIGLRAMLILTALSGAPGYLILGLFKPPYKNSSEWVKDYYAYLKRENEVSLVMDTRGGREKIPEMGSDQSFSNDTRGWTMVDEIYSEVGVVKLTNNNYISIIEVTSESLDLASRNQRNRRAAEFANFLNNNRSELQIYCTLEGINVDQKILRYKERLRDTTLDPDMRKYIKDRMKHVERISRLLRERKTYVIVKSGKLELYEDELDIPNRLRNLPKSLEAAKFVYLQLKWMIIQSQSKESMSDEEMNTKQINRVLKKADSIKGRLQSCTRGEAKRVKGDQVAGIMRSFWQGTQATVQRNNIRQTPIISHKMDKRLSKESDGKGRKKRKKKGRKKRKKKGRKKRKKKGRKKRKKKGRKKRKKK